MSASPHRGRNPHIRIMQKTSLDLLSSGGAMLGKRLAEVETISADGRPAFLQLATCGERYLLVNVYYPKAFAMSAMAEEVSG